MNRNTIPGDKNALDPSGIRLGTPWISQRGFDEEKSRELADIIADVLLASIPHCVPNPRGSSPRRAKLDFKVLNDARIRVRDLATSSGVDFEPTMHGYPHFYYLDDKGSSGTYELMGPEVHQFLNYAVTSDLSLLKHGDSQSTRVITPLGKVTGTLTCVDWDHYRLSLPAAGANLAVTWLRDLSDAYTSFNLDGSPDGTPRRLPGPIVITELWRKG